VLEWNAFQVRIKANENHLASMRHHDVMIAIFLILLVVALVLVLIALDPQQRAVDELSAVDPPPHRAHAVACFQRPIVHKAFELQVDRLADREFFRMLVLQLRAFIIGEKVLEARRAVAVVFSLSKSRQSAGKRQCLAVWTNLTSTTLDAFTLFPSMHAERRALAIATLAFSTAMHTDL